MRWETVAYDLKRGILHRWKSYLLVAVLIMIIGSVEMKQAVECYEEQFFELPSLGNYIVKWFKGIPAITEKRQRQINIPSEWIVLHSSYILLLAGYCGNDLNKNGYQNMLRSGSRVNWWKSKCIWLIASTIIFYAMFFLFLVVFAALTGGMALTPASDIWMGEFTYGVDAGYLIITFVLPLFASRCMGFMELFFELICSPVVAVIVCSGYLIASLYTSNIFLVGNATMFYRNSIYVGDSGISAPACIAVSIAGMMIFYILGKKKIKYWER